MTQIIQFYNSSLQEWFPNDSDILEKQKMI